jgi:hypothetical protein
MMTEFDRRALLQGAVLASAMTLAASPTLAANDESLVVIRGIGRQARTAEGLT